MAIQSGPWNASNFKTNGCGVHGGTRFCLGARDLCAAAYHDSGRNSEDHSKDSGQSRQTCFRCPQAS
eukprot:3855353-Prorocentrum_lima.AAC.1